METMIDEIDSRREEMLKICNILSEHNKYDDYWQGIFEQAKKGYVFDLGMVINWIGEYFKPKRILEIGTYKGGSLIQLLSNYEKFEDLDIVCFDYWQYPPWNILSPKIFRFIPSFLKKIFFRKYYMKKIESNLGLFGIPIDNIVMISGDSKVTVPTFFDSYPDKKFDYILVDGGHDKFTATTDLENVVGHIADSGIIVFDDIERDALYDVWTVFKKQHNNDFVFYEKVTSRKGVGWGFKKD
jgi:predicted O-methyltransferase YrrM